jgi:hypothetical protein
MKRVSSAVWGLLSMGVLAVAASPVCMAEANSGGVSAAERSQCESFIAERLSVWQQRLKLGDWNLKVILARASELKPKTLGNVNWDSEKKEATIRVLDPADYQMEREAMLRDMEFTVVHELIHLELAPLLSTVARSEASRRDEEHTVNAITDAILGR